MQRKNSTIEGICYSKKDDDFDLFLDIINGTDDIDDDSVLMDSESEPESVNYNDMLRVMQEVCKPVLSGQRDYQ